MKNMKTIKKIKYLLPVFTSVLYLSGCSSSAASLDKTGLEYYRLGNYTEASDSFDAAIHKDNSKAEYYIHYAFAYIELGDYQNALSKIDSALELDPNSQEAYRCQGIIYIALNQYENAIASLEKALDFAEGFVGQMEFDILDYRSLAELKSNQYQKAIDTYSILIDIDYKPGEHYYLRGIAYLMEDNTEAALSDFEAALNANDATYERYLNIYTCLAQYGYLEQATSYLEKALTLETSKQEDAFSKGKIYYYLGNYENALSYFSTARDKGNHEALLYLGKIYASQGDTNTAFLTFEQYVQTGSVSGEVYNQMGIIKFNQGDYASALSYFETGLGLNDLNSKKALLYNEAITYEYLLDFDTAASKMAAYVAAYPDDYAAKRENEFLKTR